MVLRLGVGNERVADGVFAGALTLAAGELAFAVLNPAGTTSSRLYILDLNTGAASLVGKVGGNEVVRSFVSDAGLILAPTALEEEQEPQLSHHLFLPAVSR